MMNKKHFSLGILIFVAVLIASILSIRKDVYTPERPSEALEAAASFYPLYFFTKEVAGDKAHVINITPAGAEPHEYEPTAKDITTINKSRLLVLIGGGFEPWGDKIEKNIDKEKTVVLNASEGLLTKHMEEDGQEATDPHIWLSPALAKQIVDKIAYGLSEADSDNASLYTSNAEILKAKLNDLDNEYFAGLSDCKSKNIVTSHAAFGYMADSYGLNQVPIAGLSPESEPSPKQLAEIAKFAKDNKVEYIFFESLTSPKLSQTIAKEINAETLVLNPIEGLTAEEVASGRDYFTEMRSNLRNLQIALQCQTK